MFTALVLQLVQCTVQIPNKVETSDSQGDNLVDKDVLIVKSYEDALRAARNFMSIFLKKYVGFFIVIQRICDFNMECFICP